MSTHIYTVAKVKYRLDKIITGRTSLGQTLVVNFRDDNWLTPFDKIDTTSNGFWLKSLYVHFENMTTIDF